MVRNKLHILIIFISIVLILSLGFYFFLRGDFESTDPFKAVPDDASLIIQVRAPFFNIRTTLEGNKIWNEILSFPAVSKLNTHFLMLDSILSGNRQVAEMVKKSLITLSIHKSGKNKIDFIAYMPLLSRMDEQHLFNMVDRNVEGKAVITGRKYSGTMIRDVKFSDQPGIDFSFTFSNGLVMISPSGILLEEAIRRLDRGNENNMPQGFVKVSKTAGQNVEANIFISYKTIPGILSLLMNEKYKNDVEDFTALADWGELDASIRDNVLLLNGFTIASQSDHEYLGIFTDQQPQKIEIEKVIPDQVAAFLVFSIEDFGRFKRQYQEYLRSKGELEQYQAEIDAVNKNFQINLEDLFYSFIDREAGVLFTDNKNYDRDQNTFFILRTISRNQAEDAILEIISKVAESRKTGSQPMIQNYRMDNETQLKIYEMPVPFLASKLVGKVFDGIPNQYCTFYDNYLVFGNSIPALAKYIHTNLLQNNLSSDLEFNKISNFMSSRANIYFYMNVSRSAESVQKYLNDKAANKLEENRDHLKDFNALALQVTNEGDLFYHNIFLNYSSDEIYEPQTVWESRLDHSFDFKPRILINHNTQEKEIFIQDKQNNIYLINSSGRVIWKLLLDGKILSDVYQIDYYKNGKLQYLFNTETSIHLIDRNGNYVEKYPVTLRAKATNGMAVFDYEKDKDYRFIIAAEDRQIYAYNKEGQTVKGWSPGKTEQVISRPLHHYRLGEMDYIVGTDGYTTYILDRKGNPRIHVKDHFLISTNNDFRPDLNPSGGKSRIAVTDTSGHVHFIYFDGTTEEIVCEIFSDRHYFEYTDLDGNGKMEFFFAEGNELKVFNSDRKIRFSRQFRSEISYSPVGYEFSANDIKIGIVCSNSNEIYLINKDGSNYEGFPLEGNTPFSITNLNRSTSKFNLLTGSNQNFLYNYSVK